MEQTQTTPEQETALKILQTSNSIATSEQLSVVIGNSKIPKYHNLTEGERVRWLGQQISALNYMVHSSRIPSDMDLLIDASFVNQTIMEDEGMRTLTLVEIQEAFRKGIMKEFGDYFGISPVSLVGFLKGFIQSPKRQKALSILVEKKQQRIEEEINREKRMFYESRVKDLKHPFWKSAKGAHMKSEEDSFAHRKKIKEQRDAIMLEYDETKKH